MRAAILVALLALASPALAGKPKPSGPVRAYKGPEGQIVVMVMVNDDHEMLVHLRNLGGDLEGKTLLYEVDDQGHDRKDVYVVKKRGSKTYHSNILIERDGEWHFFHPKNFKIEFDVVYSDTASQKYKLDDVMNAYQP